jgi:GTPase involved in cell partitioning and DNA repair
MLFQLIPLPGTAQAKIEDASEGVGLGFEFLKHLSRAKVLLHILDVFAN